MRRPFHPVEILVLLVVSLVLLGLVVQRANLVKSCERVNTVRDQVNAQGVILRDFLQSAQDARLASGDDEVAERYRRLWLRINTIDKPDCNEVVGYLP